MNTLSRKHELIVAFSLFAFMVITRFHHFGSALHLPDASWAIFFIGGFYLRRLSIMVVLMALAGLIDYFSITQLGTSSYCVTPAYGFLVPTYAALWFGGRWFAGVYRPQWSSLLPLVASAAVATVLAFAISNAAFYFFSGKFEEMALLEYASSVAKYLGSFLKTTLGYVAAAAVIHVALLAMSSSVSSPSADHRA